MLPSTMRFIERDWLSSNQVVFHDSAEQASLVDTGYVKHKALTHRLDDHACGYRTRSTGPMTTFIEIRDVPS